MKLTDISVRALKKPEQGATIFYDDTLAGFGVRVSQAGTKSFVLTHGVRRTRETIGRVGILSLSDARQEAKRRCAEYTLGKHRPRSVTWKAAREEFLRVKGEILKAKTVAGYRIHLAYFPFGETKLSDITEGELQTDLGKVRKKGQRHNTFVCLRTFFRWAYRKHYIDRNPVERMEPTKVGAPRKRVLEGMKGMRLWRFFRPITTHFGAGYRTVLTNHAARPISIPTTSPIHIPRLKAYRGAILGHLTCCFFHLFPPLASQFCDMTSAVSQAAFLSNWAEIHHIRKPDLYGRRLICKSGRGRGERRNVAGDEADETCGRHSCRLNCCLLCTTRYCYGRDTGCRPLPPEGIACSLSRICRHACGSHAHAAAILLRMSQ